MYQLAYLGSSCHHEIPYPIKRNRLLEEIADFRFRKRNIQKVKRNIFKKILLEHISRKLLASKHTGLKVKN
jgi:hypothetical protein